MTGKCTSAEGWSGEDADSEPEVTSQTHTCAHRRPPATLLHPGRPRIHTGMPAPPQSSAMFLLIACNSGAVFTYGTFTNTISFNSAML